MVGWTLLLVLILAAFILLLLQRMYYEYKIKMAQRRLAGKVRRNWIRNQNRTIFSLLK